MHKGENEVERWNKDTNSKYRTALEPIDFMMYDDTEPQRFQKFFEGNLIVLKFQVLVPKDI